MNGIFFLFIFSFNGLDAATLSDEDLKVEILGYFEGPALSSAIDDENPWASYNQWQCFPVEQVWPGRSYVIYNRWKSSPSFIVQTSKSILVFELSADIEVDTEIELEWWQRLTLSADQLCFYAAFLQDIEDGIQLWILSRMKSTSASWKEENVVEPLFAIENYPTSM